jgi:outer membrane protein OmpA-like peptidoglycan-associated protein
MDRKIAVGFVFLICLGCQTTSTKTSSRPGPAFGETVRAPFNQMVMNARPSEQVLGSVYFDFDDAHLSDGAKYELDLVAAILSQQPGLVIVEGHADHVNTERYNVPLGYRRALAVAEYLKSAGVWDERLVVQSFGENRPLATNWSEQGRAQNRRAVIKLIAPGLGMSGQEAVLVHTRLMVQEAVGKEPARPVGEAPAAPSPKSPSEK